MIEFREIQKKYGQEEVIKEHSFKIEDGELFVLVGQSGSGKTTTLKMINRLVEADSGSIFIDGKDITSIPLRKLRLDIGYVLQSIALFPNLTVRENIELIPEMKKWQAAKRHKESDELLEKVGLEALKYKDRYPRELSGGEQQRVGILRAIIAQPKILLMDEPFSALDPISRKSLQLLTKSLHKEFNMTIVFVTHDMSEALDIADRICVMKEGEILQIASPKDIRENPANEYVKSLFEDNKKGDAL
ncbi:MAG: ABC transporter ATP-binding protein [Lachnospiraceae bacterium]|nr:MAG: ABC transporter ATP-binding protein [Lachnospiraceae bacterium]